MVTHGKCPLSSQDEFIDLAIGFFLPVVNYWNVFAIRKNDRALFAINPNPLSGSCLEFKNLGSIKSIFAGYSHVCLISDEGNVRCLGNNRFGQLGNGYTSPDDGNAEMVIGSEISNLKNIKQIDAAKFKNCALDTSGKVKCWGFVNELNLNKDAPKTIWTEPRDMGLTDVLAVSFYSFLRPKGELLWRNYPDLMRPPRALIKSVMLPDAVDAVVAQHNYCLYSTPNDLTCTLNTSFRPNEFIKLEGIDQLVAERDGSGCYLKKGKIYCWYSKTSLDFNIQDAELIPPGQVNFKRVAIVSDGMGPAFSYIPKVAALDENNHLWMERDMARSIRNPDLSLAFSPY